MGIIDQFTKKALTIKALGPKGFTIEVPFNPKEYTLEKSVAYAETAKLGTDSPTLNFTHGNVEKLSFDLLVDTTDYFPGDPRRDARKTVDQLMKLIEIDGDTHVPPICTFEWSGLVMRGVVESIKRQFVLFDPSGVPTRVMLTLAVKRFDDSTLQKKKENPNSPDKTRTVVVAAGDTLPAIAFRAYGDDAQWRYIAVANRLADPSRLVPGQVLQVPAIPEAG